MLGLYLYQVCEGDKGIREDVLVFWLEVLMFNGFSNWNRGWLFPKCYDAGFFTKQLTSSNTYSPALVFNTKQSISSFLLPAKAIGSPLTSVCVSISSVSVKYNHWQEKSQKWMTYIRLIDFLVMKLCLPEKKKTIFRWIICYVNK